ncbi:TRAF interacting protein no poles [Calliopsis andreniformis]|uniref:TRAF interacting protein no poles n=1 Tax=Calliopsis andreniformis TaxID=337506 RepID=UPI003FCEE506
MNVVCVICSDLLIPSDDVFHTPCGHIFHFVCLSQWLERSKSCPQCREKTTAHKIHRIYFNFSNNDTIIEDATSLQDKLDKLNFQLLVKEKDIKHYTQKCETLEKQNGELRKEVYKVESELNKKNSTIYAFKEQIKYFKEQNLEVESIKKEVEQLKKKNENYKNIQTLLEASTEDIDEMISKTSDPNTLITYISVMKREMMISLNKRRELRSKMKSLQQELTKVSMERNFLSEEHTKRKKLEKDLMQCESEKMLLENKLRDMQQNPPLARKSNSFNTDAMDKINCNLDSVSEQNGIKKTLNSMNMKKVDTPKQEKSQSIATSETNEKDSPYLPIKAGGVFGFKQHFVAQKRTQIPHSSILTKKPRIDQPRALNEKVTTNIITYDGFGGHSKLDQFPSPCSTKIRKAKDEISKVKRLKHDDSK